MPHPRSTRSLPGRIALVSTGLLLGLLLAEGGLRATRLDWWLLRQQLATDHPEIRPLCQASDDPVLARQPTPSATHTLQRPKGPMVVHTDRFGFRGPDRDPDRAPGTIRILVFGGSNVYGFDMDDHQTWPLQLERELRPRLEVPVEVYNGGVGGFDPWTTCRWASLASPELEPDLIILALSNFDLPRMFPSEVDDLSRYFVGVPGAWEDQLGSRLLALPGSPEGATAVALLDRFALARLTAIAAFHLQRLQSPPPPAEPDAVTLACIQQLAARYPTMLFGVPATPYQTQQAWAEATGLELFHLHAGGRPPEFSALHPDPGVYTWYAQELATWLIEQGPLR
jgi:hypothetical protein